MAEKEKYPIFTSPKGVAKWAHLNVPQTKIGEKAVEPNYNVTVLYDPNDAAYLSFKGEIEKSHDAAFVAVKKANPKKKYKDEGITNIFGDDTNKDGEPTGKAYAKFKHKASGKRKDGTIWTYKPALFDAKGTPLAAGTVVYGGSVLKVAYGVKHTAMETGSFYTSLQLQAVQVLELKSAYVKEASAYGFASEEGYTEDEGQNAFGEQGEVTDEAADAAQSKDF